MAATPSEKFAIILALGIFIVLQGLYSNGIIIHVSGDRELKPPAPAPTEIGQEKQRDTSSNNDPQADSDRSPKSDAAPALDGSAELQSEKVSSQSGQSDEESAHHWWRDPVTVFTAVLAFAALVQLSIYHRQAKHMRESLDIARDTAEKQLRAYVTNANPTATEGVEDMVRFTVVAKNSGQTLARDVVINLQILETGAPYDGPWDLGTLDPERHVSKTVVGPGNEIKLWKERRVDEATRMEIRGGQKMIWYFGRIGYVDMFGQTRETSFRCAIGGDVSREVTELFFYKTGNEAT